MGMSMKRLCLAAILSLAFLFILQIAWAGKAQGEDANAPSGPHVQPSEEGDSFFGDLFKVYMPRSKCMFNEPYLIGLHLVSDTLIAAAYYSIPIGLVYFIRKRRDIAFNWIFVMFAAFILACGTTHVFGVWAIWQPIYRLDGIVKLITALLSIGTALALWPLIPKALALPSPAQLEARVKERTSELAQANTALRDEADARAAAETAHARMAAIVEHCDDAIIGKTLEGVITSWNTGATRLFGYCAPEAIGKPMALLFPADRAEEEPSILERLRRGESIEHYETVRQKKDGRRIDVSVTVSPIKDSSGIVIGASNIARDITDRRRAEIEREILLQNEKTARSEAEHASRMKDEFLATLSHELRTPLNAIYGWSQMLRRHNNSHDPELSEGLEVIERNTKVQTKLIEDLLDMSRIISGKIRLDVQPADLASILEEVIQSIAPAAAAKNIRIQPVLDPQAGMVTGDPGRLQQIFWNLLSNAIKFTQKGGAVQVHLERVNSHVEVRFADNGQGMNLQLLPHVFERFRQGDSSSTRRYGGLGLGLAIVKHLVELHGGTVAARSLGEGQGATFTVALPLRGVIPESVVPAQERSHPTSESAPTKSLGLPSLKGLRILVVDDDPDARQLIERLLTEAGAMVVTASAAAEAVEHIQRKEQRPDVLLSDIGMADEDGYSLIRRIRRLPIDEGAEIPAIAITAFARTEDRRKAMLAGFQMHVAKPADAAELVTMVASLTGLIRDN